MAFSFVFPYVFSVFRTGILCARCGKKIELGQTIVPYYHKKDKTKKFTLYRHIPEDCSG